MLQKTLIILCLFVLAVPVLAQDVDTTWVRRYSGPGQPGMDYDFASAMAVDSHGNVFVTGYSFGVWDDYTTMKYYPNGDTAWVRRHNGSANDKDRATSIAVDDSGNVYVTGGAINIVGTWWDYVTIKYFPNGDTAWLRVYNGPAHSFDMAAAIAVDHSGNVYVTGNSEGSGTTFDYCTLKYDSEGDISWVRRYNGLANGQDRGYAIAVDDSGNVYVTGDSWSETLFDYVTIKYDADGDTAWVRRYNGPGDGNDAAHAITIDDLGNVYVTGESYSGKAGYAYATVKYRANGDTTWVRRCCGGSANAITLDDFGSVYVTGPGGTAKYDTAGNQLWVEPWGGVDLAVDNYGNVYVGGTVGSGASSDYLCVKYYPEGDTAWTRTYDGTAHADDVAGPIAVDGFGNVYLSGSSMGEESGWDYTTVKYWQNHPPDPFSLIRPENGSLVFPWVDFDWEDAADPDPWDTVRYDLYVSTSPSFHPDSTVVHSDLLTSDHSEVFELGTYYWKVRAHDQYTEVFSDQTCSFTIVSPGALVGYWKFDEASGDTANDSSGYGNHGTLTHGPNRVQSLPLLGQALNLDGTDDHVVIPDAPSLDMTGPFTTMAWIYPETLPPGTEDAQIASLINKWLNYILQTGEGAPHKPGRLRVVAQDSQGHWHALESDSVLVLNQWQHIVGLWDGDSLKLFINARQIASLYIESFVPGPFNDQNLYIGTEKGTWQFFDGSIDEVKIYCRPLSLEEIGTEFESGFIRGDANGDGIINVGDVVYLVSYLYKNGPAPDPEEAGDANCDGIVNLGDIVYLVSYLYKNGPPPGCP